MVSDINGTAKLLSYLLDNLTGESHAAQCSCLLYSVVNAHKLNRFLPLFVLPSFPSIPHTPFSPSPLSPLPSFSIALFPSLPPLSPSLLSSPSYPPSPPPPPFFLFFILSLFLVCPRPPEREWIQIAPPRSRQSKLHRDLKLMYTHNTTLCLCICLISCLLPLVFLQ